MRQHLNPTCDMCQAAPSYLQRKVPAAAAAAARAAQPSIHRPCATSPFCTSNIAAHALQKARLRQPRAPSCQRWQGLGGRDGRPAWRSRVRVSAACRVRSGQVRSEPNGQRVGRTAWQAAGSPPLGEPVGSRLAARPPPAPSLLTPPFPEESSTADSLQIQLCAPPQQQRSVVVASSRRGHRLRRLLPPLVARRIPQGCLVLLGAGAGRRLPVNTCCCGGHGLGCLLPHELDHLAA
jgi:hypothetical protein